MWSVCSLHTMGMTKGIDGLMRLKQVSKFWCTNIAAYMRGPALVLVPNLAAKVNMIRLFWWLGLWRVSVTKSHFTTSVKKIICTVHALSLNPCWSLAEKPLHNTLEILDTSKEDFLKWAAYARTMQLPGSNWNATGSLLQSLGAHCIINFARCTASPFWWKESRPVQMSKWWPHLQLHAKGCHIVA